MGSYLTIIAGSIRKNGLRGTLRAAGRYAATVLSIARDSRFDEETGLETGRHVEVAEMTDVTSPHRAHGIRYEPSRAAPFRRLMRSLELPTDATFVDVGCGMGRVLLLAAEFGFSRIVGIEYSPALCEIARHNITTNAGAEISVVECDAANYAFPAEQRVIYMFNPFDETVMNRVLDRIVESLERFPRPMWLIYQYPAQHHVIESRGIFTAVKHVRHGGCEFVVYRNH